jgi:hypothetical protein
MLENSSVVSEAASISSQPKSSAASSLPVFISLCAAALFGCFFLPWVSIGGLFVATGYQFTLGPHAGDEAKIFLAIPITALLAIFVGFLSRKQQRGAARIAGLMPIAGLIYVMVRNGKDVVEVLGAGAWLSICLGVALFILGCVKPKP